MCSGSSFMAVNRSMALPHNFSRQHWAVFLNRRQTKQQENALVSDAILFVRLFERASGAASFLPDNFSWIWRNGRLREPDSQRNVCLAARKRIMSDQVRNVPLLHLDYRDTRMVMGQNAKRITTNNKCHCKRTLHFSIPPLSHFDFSNHTDILYPGER